jgi:ribonuclease HI
MSSSKKIIDYFQPVHPTGSKVKIFPIEEGSSYTLHFDGGSRGNPGPGGCGWVLHKGSVEIYAGMSPLGPCTNNYAEYKGLEQGLLSALNKNYCELTVYGDSLLVINQVMGVWKCKSPNLIPILKRINKLKAQFEYIEILHVRREENKRADALANEAMDIQDINNLSSASR